MSEDGPAAASRVTARGTVQLAATALVGAVGGFIIQVCLARKLGPESYGIFTVAASVIVWWEFATNSLLTNTISKIISDHIKSWREVAGSAVVVQAVWGLVAGSALWFAAPFIAALLNDPASAVYLRLFAIDIPPVALLTALVESLRGRREFTRYSVTMLFYWCSKALLMCGLVLAGLSVRGAIIGSISASVIAVAAGWVLLRIGVPRATFPIMQIIKFGVPVMATGVTFRLLQNVDIWMLKSLSQDDVMVGHYGTATAVVQAALLVGAALNATVLPAIARSISAKDLKATRDTTREAYRFVAVMMGLPIAVMASSATAVISLVFSGEYAPAGPPGAILSIAATGFAFLGVAQVILISAGRPLWCFAALVPLLALDIGLNWLFIPVLGMEGAAIATTITAVVGAAVMAMLVWGLYRSGPRVGELLRVAVASGMSAGVGLIMGLSGALVLVQVVAVSVTYSVCLFAFGAITKPDLEALRFWERADTSTE